MSIKTSPGWIRRPPADLLGVLIVVALANATVFYDAAGFHGSLSPLRIVAGLLFVLLVPGYAAVAALFPEAGHAPGKTRLRSGQIWTRIRTSGQESTDRPRGIDVWERIGLSFALSLAVVPLLAMVVTLSPLPFAAASIFSAISAFTVLCVLIAVKRRLSLPADDRFRISVTGWLTERKRSYPGSSSRGEMVLNIALVVAIVFAVGTFGFAVLSPQDGETYTEFYVLSENDADELVAADYPDTLTVGESQELYTGIENHERRTVEYDVVVQLQRVEETDEGLAIDEQYEVDRFSVTLDPDERWVDERDLTVSEELTDDDLRLQFLLYEDSVPETPTSETAYRDLHIWIDVEPPGPTPTDAEDGEQVGQ